MKGEQNHQGLPTANKFPFPSEMNLTQKQRKKLKQLARLQRTLNALLFLQIILHTSKLD